MFLSFKRTNNRIHQATGEGLSLISAPVGRFGATPLFACDHVKGNATISLLSMREAEGKLFRST
jgi:hypothetical protein